MAFKDEKVLTDVDGVVVPQYWNETTQKWEPVKGENGAYFVQYIGTAPQTPTDGNADGGTFENDGINLDGGEF